jgi:integrase
MALTITVVLDTRRLKQKTQNYPVKLRVTHDRITIDYQTVYNLTQEEFDRLTATRISNDLQSVRDSLKEIKRTADNAAKEMEPFSFLEFEREFIVGNSQFKRRKAKEDELPATGFEFDYSPYEKRFPILKEVHPGKDCISFTFLNYVRRLLQEGRIGSALNYQDTYFSLKRFSGNVQFSKVTTSYLVQYEQWQLTKEKNSKTTVGIKLRPLRAIFNQAIEDKIIRADKYPFGKRKYMIPTSRNVKKALTLDEIKGIYNCVMETENEQKAKDLWLFMYFGNGMNPKDLVYLRFKNIQDEYLIFLRAKTERTTRADPKPITVYLNDEMRDIINRWGNCKQSQNDFLFPVMDEELDLMRQHQLVKSFTVFINNNMVKVMKKIGLNKKASTIVSRHSFSTVMKRSGASTEYIQEALGHTVKSTTENYLDSFENEVKKELSKKLTDFKRIA